MKEPVMRRTPWLVIAGLVVAGAAWALDPPNTVPAPAETAPEAAAETGPRTADPPAPAEPVAEPASAEEDDETLPPPPVKSTGPTPQRFDPSEEVRADFPVSFPVDI
jgi:hypothetical protein